MIRRAFFWSLLLATLSIFVAAQRQSDEPDAVPPSPALRESGSEDQESGPPRFRASVDQVVLYPSVYDEEGNLVGGLSQQDFLIYEDKVEQEVTSFALTNVPTSIGIVLDSSGSVRQKWNLLTDAVDLFLELNHPQNELFLIKFDDEVDLEEDFTRDPEDIRDAIFNIVSKGGTALYDAIYLAAEKVTEGQEPKKVLLVFTDGEDKDSFYSHPELLGKVREAETQIFIVAFLDDELEDGGGFFGIFKSEREKVTEKINEVAEVTGGKSFFPQETDELIEAFGQIARELNNQYRLAYISNNPKNDGAWREIDVRIRDAKERGLKVRARKGYYSRGDS